MGQGSSCAKPAEQYASPLSADDMVALATTLLAHPERGPSLREKFRETENMGRGSPVHVPAQVLSQAPEMMLKVMKGAVRRKYCPHLENVCATGVALALLPLCAEWRLEVKCDDAGEEAVAAFYAALEQPTCTVGELSIIGAAFGTVAAAAQLGHCLSVNCSTIRRLTILNVVGFCGKAVWTAFSRSLSFNSTLQEFCLDGCSYGQENSPHVGATLGDSLKLSTLREVSIRNRLGGRPGAHPTTLDMEGWGTMLKHSSTITNLNLGFRLPQGAPGGLLVPVCETLHTNTTLKRLTIGNIAATVLHGAHVEMVTGRDDDILSLVDMLLQNKGLRYLNISNCGVLCNASVFDQGLSQNITLEELHVSVNAAGAEALMNVLAAVGGTSSCTGPHLKSLWLGDYFYGESQYFPTAIVLATMLALNGTLKELYLGFAPYKNEEWATTILPALANNHSLRKLYLTSCPGVDGGLVYDALLELLNSNTSITNIRLDDTPLGKDGKTPAVESILHANKEYRAAMKNAPTTCTASCCLVLCGYPFGGKSTLLQTMIRRHSSSTDFSNTAIAKSNNRARGVDILPLTISNLTMWIWDFSGQRKFHALQDCIFPNARSVHAAIAFVFVFNPIILPGSGTIGGEARLKKKYQFEQEFSYWLKFIRSNAKQLPVGVCKPAVVVVVTHKDKVVNMIDEMKFNMMVEEWVHGMAVRFDDMVTLEEGNILLVDATNENDISFIGFEHHVIQLFHDRIRQVGQVPFVCDDIARALEASRGQQLEPMISFDNFVKLCLSVVKASTKCNKSQHKALEKLLSSRTKNKFAKVIATYLRDAGQVLYLRDLDFLVTNPRWFTQGILGYLIDTFSADNAPTAPAAHNLEESIQSANQVDSVFSKTSLAKPLQLAIGNVGLNHAGANTDQLILLMEKLDLCFRDDEGYCIPALLPDQDGKAERGESDREWLPGLPSSSSECIFVSRRLECLDRLRTFITPGFFPRLQVVLKNLADQWGIEGRNCDYTLEKGFCRLILDGMQILVEYSDYEFLDIMIKSSLSQHDTTEFLEVKIISEIRRLCASSKGCQGVTLVEAIIRPDCVKENITWCRFRHSLRVTSLEHQLVSAPDLEYSWPAVMDENGKIVLRAKEYKPQYLLDQKRIGRKPVVPQDLLDPDWIGLKQEDCYPDSNVNAGRRRGVAVIVNMVRYNMRGLIWAGGREDQAKLMKLIEDLQFEEKILVDSKAGELQRQLKEIAATSISAEDESFLCFLMGHGDSTLDGEHFIWDQDDGMIFLDDMVRPFRTCQHLQGKPKVFFVISDRGGYKPWAYHQPEFNVQHSTGWKEGTEVRYLHEFTDCLMVFSTSAGSVSARYPEYGSPFVGALVSHFNHDKRQKMDVLGILNDVKMEVSAQEHETKDDTVFGQCPVVSDTLIKRLYWRSKAG